jgi:hypothetical protein
LLLPTLMFWSVVDVLLPTLMFTEISTTLQNINVGNSNIYNTPEH